MVRENRCIIKRNAGMSLGELLISLVVFAIFSAVLYIALAGGLRYGEMSGSASKLEEASIRIKEAISREFRESLPFSDNDRLLKLFASGKPVLFKPDNAAPTSSEIIFTIPNFMSVTADTTSLSLDTPAALQTVRFAVENSSTLIEERTRYASDGSISEAKKQKILALQGKKMTLTADYRGARSLFITLVCQDERKKVSVSFNAITQNK